MIQRLFILGLGQVGKSLLDIVLSENLFTTQNIRIIDKDPGTFKAYTDRGGSIQNCIPMYVKSDNYREVLRYCTDGDILVDLGNGIDNYLMAKMCLENGIHYMSSCDDCFDDMFNCFTFEGHFDKYKQLQRKHSGGATSVIEFGMNPGMVSLFVKKALADVVANDDSEFVKDNRDNLKKLLLEGRYNLLAKNLKVTDIVEVDHDFSVAHPDLPANKVYSTWNVPDYAIEINERSIVKVGTNNSVGMFIDRHKDVMGDGVYYYDSRSGLFISDRTSLNNKVTHYSPVTKDNKFTGYIVAHEELFSMYDYYSFKSDDSRVEYAPNVVFIYKPCDLAVSSLQNAGDDAEYQILTKDLLDGAGECVGVVVSGEHFSSRYAGNILKASEDRKETPTILQVSASVYACLRYVIAHQDDGLLFPDDICDIEFLFDTAKPYFGEITVRTV